MDPSLANDCRVTFSYEIIHVPHDDAGIQKYMDKYRAFRLLSLELAPEAFASTYAREVAFDDDTWHARLSNPAANTFIAIADSDKIVSMLTMMGPLPYGSEMMPPAENPWMAISTPFNRGKTEALHFRLNAVFTLPRARRRGISKALIRASIEYTEKSRGTGRVIFSTVVEADNFSARALYAASGFAKTRTLTAAESGVGSGIELLVHKPSVLLE